MAKCATCGKFLAAKDGAGCSRCGQCFHRSCAQVPHTAKLGRDWRCHECCSKTPCSSGKDGSKGDGATDSAGSRASTNSSFKDVNEVDEAEENRLLRDAVRSLQADLGQQIRLLRMDLREMKEDLSSFRRDMADIRNLLAKNTDKIDNLESRLAAVENGEPFVSSPDTVDHLKQTVDQLKTEINDRDQELLAADIEIANLPESPGENVLHTVELVAKKLGVQVEARDIIFAERVGPRSEGSSKSREADAGKKRGRRIVVRLARRTLRDELLKSARVRRGATSADLGFTAPPQKFYLNERQLPLRDGNLLGRGEVEF